MEARRSVTPGHDRLRWGGPWECGPGWSRLLTSLRIRLGRRAGRRPAARDGRGGHDVNGGHGGHGGHGG